MPPCNWKPSGPTPEAEHPELAQEEAEDSHLVLAKSAEPPGEAWGTASSELARPKGHSSLLGTGDAWMLFLVCGSVLACGRHPSVRVRVQVREYTSV